MARIFDGYSSCSVKALVNISKSDHLITRPCCCITDGKHCSEGLETCCKNSAASPVCYPGENRQAGWMDGWIRTMVGLGLGEWVGPTWVGGTMATVFKKKVKEQTWQFWIIKNCSREGSSPQAAMNLSRQTWLALKTGETLWISKAKLRLLSWDIRAIPYVNKIC